MLPYHIKYLFLMQKQHQEYLSTWGECNLVLVTCWPEKIIIRKWSHNFTSLEDHLADDKKVIMLQFPIYFAHATTMHKLQYYHGLRCVTKCIRRKLFSSIFPSLSTEAGKVTGRWESFSWPYWWTKFKPNTG